MSGNTIAKALAWTASQIKAAGIEEIRLESRLLVAHALGKTPDYVFAYPERSLDQQTWRRLSEIVARRVRREPMAHITGMREFWSLPFKFTADTLVPRPDSETLVEAVLDSTTDGDLALLDLGTGSGCLMLALLHERPGWTGLGIDLSDAALAVAAENAEALGLTERCSFERHDWNQALPGRFDLVIANPPYIATSDRLNLAPEVAGYEPPEALFAGADGLDAYRVLVPKVVALLRPGGNFYLEVGLAQADPVAALLGRHGYRAIARRPDLAGISRCVFASL